MEKDRGVHIETATNRFYGLLQLPSFSYVLMFSLYASVTLLHCDGGYDAATAAGNKRMLSQTRQRGAREK